MELGEGGVSISQLYAGDAEGPHITAGVVGGVQLLLTGDDLQRRASVTQGDASSSARKQHGAAW